MKKRNNSYKILPFIALFITMPAFSEEFCVTNTPELNQALFVSGANNQNDVIKIKQGTYIVDSKGFFGFGFQYLAAVDENFDIEVSGGWADFFNNPCGQQFNDPNSTLLDGDGLRRVLNIEMGEGDVSLTNFRIFDGYFTSDLFVAGGGLRIDLKSNSTARIERIIFYENYAPQAGALIVFGAGNSRVYLKNNLILSNYSDNKDFVVSLSASENYAINNTIMFNIGSGIITSLNSGLGNKALFANNILWQNDIADYAIFGGDDTELYLYNNNLGNQLSTLPINTVQSGNISQTPQFDTTGAFNFNPVSGSPLINAGKTAPFIVPIPTPFELAWSYSLLDIEGGDRVNNSRIDIGAFEAPLSSLPDLIFANGLE